MKTTSADDKIRKLYQVIAVASIVVITATTVYGIVASFIQGVDVVGETFVTVEFPPVSVFPLFYSKPVTWLSAAIVALFFSALELSRKRIARIPKSVRSMIKFLAFFIAAMAFYEVLFNFTLWSGLIAASQIKGELNPDLIKNPFPNPKTPWNIVFATKLFTVLTIVSGYLFYYLQRMDSEKL